MKTIINIKTNEEIKKEARKIAENLGLSLSAIINAYLRQFIRNKEIYFSLTNKMSSGLEELLGKIELDIQKKKNISKEISSAPELKKYLSSL